MKNNHLNVNSFQEVPLRDENRDQTIDNNFLIKQNEVERLNKDIYRSDIDKFRLFTQMLRTNAVYKKAIIYHQ